MKLSCDTMFKNWVALAHFNNSFNQSIKMLILKGGSQSNQTHFAHR